jgi:hypothetical protein
MQVCHRERTAKEDIPAIAKGKRQKRSCFGIKKRGGRRFRKPNGARFDWRARRYVQGRE